MSTQEIIESGSTQPQEYGVLPSNINLMVSSITPAVNCDVTVINSIPLRGIHSTPEGELYVSFYQEGVLQVSSVRGRKLKRYIRQHIFEHTGSIAKDSEIRDCVDQIEAECDFRGTTITLFNRAAKDGDDLVIDGGNCHYRIAKTGWYEDRAPLALFKRPSGMLNLATPVKGGDLKKLLRFVNVRHEEAKLLLLVHVVASFIEDIPHPPLIFYGPQGASKSTILRFYCSLVDPMLVEDVSFRNEKEFMLAASQRWVVGMDNVSFLDRGVSDLHCKLVTGACYTARMLYTDEDMVIRRFRRVVIINGINLPVDRPDLMDRCILMPLDRIPAEQRRSEMELNQEFTAIRGELLGACFDTLSKAMAILPTIKLDKLERMADFQIWGCAIAQALG